MPRAAARGVRRSSGHHALDKLASPHRSPPSRSDPHGEGLDDASPRRGLTSGRPRLHVGSETNIRHPSAGPRVRPGSYGRSHTPKPSTCEPAPLPTRQISGPRIWSLGRDAAIVAMSLKLRHEKRKGGGGRRTAKEGEELGPQRHPSGETLRTSGEASRTRLRHPPPRR